MNPMSRSGPRIRVAAAAFLLSTAVACGTPATPTPAADGGGGGSSVTLSGSAFSEASISVPVGTTVTFTNEDSFAHTVTNGVDGTPAPDAIFDEPLSGGASVDITFDQAGTFDVTCMIHSSMNMTVVVEG
jgi:plastocyanin